MEIGKIDCGAWLTLQAVDKRVGEVRLKILPIATDFLFPENTDTKTAVDAIAKFVVDWNLEADGVAVPCNDDTKAKYLAYLIRLEATVVEGQAPEFVVLHIARFAADINNFLGN